MNKRYVCLTFAMPHIDAGSILTPVKTMFENNDRLGEITRNNGVNIAHGVICGFI